MRITRSRIAAPALALSIAFTPVLAGCSDDSAGPEVGADVEDVVEEDEGLGQDDAVEEELEEEPLEEEPVGGALDEQAAGFVGQMVTVSAEVTEVVDPSAIRIGGEGLGGESLLVLSGPAATFAETGFEVDQGLVDDQAIVQVTGTVREFDLVGFEEEFGVDYDDALFEPFEGQHVIVADDVSTLVGEQLTIAGNVQELISTVAFRLSGVGWNVVVLDAEQAEVAEGEFVQVQGTVRRFELTTFEDEFGVDLDDALYADFEGDLVLVAENVAPAPQPE